MNKRRIAAVFFLNAFIVATLLTSQNCGRVSISEKVTEPSTHVPLSVSVNSELVIEVDMNKPEIFAIPTNSNATVKIAQISLDESVSVLTATTRLQGQIIIDPQTFNITYTPATGLIDEDLTRLYVTGTDGSQIAIDALFVITNPDADAFPESNALVYGKTADDRVYLQDKLAGYKPPGMADIFNKWGRFSGEMWYNSASEIKTLPALAYCNSGVNLTTGLFNPAVDPSTGTTINPGTHTPCVNNSQFVATSWVLRPNPDRIYCSANAGRLTGFVSPLGFEKYEHEAILTSANNDDDTIGIVIAFLRDDAGTNHVLAALRNQGGNAPNQGWGIGYFKNGTAVKYFGAKSVGGTFPSGTKPTPGWSNRMTKVLVERKGNMITAYASPWDMAESSLTVTDDSKITLDLGLAANGLEIFKGPRPYGYLSLSQLGSEFRGVKFNTGADDSYVYDLENKIIYHKQADGKYVQRKDQDAFSHIGYPRRVGNPDTGKLFQLNANKTYNLLN